MQVPVQTQPVPVQVVPVSVPMQVQPEPVQVLVSVQVQSPVQVVSSPKLVLHVFKNPGLVHVVYIDTGSISHSMHR